MIYGLFMLCLVGYWLGDHGRCICVWPAGCHLVTQVLQQGPPFASHQKFKLVFAGYTSSIGLRGRERHVYVQSLLSVHACMHACMHVVQRGGGPNAVLRKVAGCCLVVCARVGLELLASRLHAQSGCKCSPSDQDLGRALVLVGCVKLASV